jgi:hypothetical protein
VPKARRKLASRPPARATKHEARPILPKSALISPITAGGRTLNLAVPEPQAVDLSPRVDLDGASFGLETARGNDPVPFGTSLLSPQAKDPLPSDPTLANQKRATVPYVGLSLSAPTN